MTLLKTIQTAIVPVIVALPLYVQAQSVAHIGEYGISTKEFIWVFKKNHAKKSDLTYANLTQYLDLYVDFKLKVLEAKRLGFDKDTAFVNEVSNFEKILRGKYGNRHKDLDLMINEYKEGVLMFNISEQKVWSANSKDVQVSEEQIEKLEKQWIADLRNRYTVRKDEGELNKLTKY